jgi:hypothetical protein
MMQPIWQIDSRDVIGLQGRDPEFTAFVNDLLTAQVQGGRVALGVLRLTLKTQAPDGGIDAAVDQAVPAGFDPTGYFDVPNCWQFKACPTGNIKPAKKKKGGQEAALREEIRKSEAARLVAGGYRYLFCIADDLAAPEKARWEGWLLDEARKIEANACPPKVVTASNLATWANRFPGVILPFRPYLGALSSLRTWGSEITRVTPHFVPVVAWQTTTEIIRSHADLTRPCLRVVQTVQGEAGVGKTRCVYEALTSNRDNHARVIYTRNEIEAERVADLLANDDRFCGLIVADECSVRFRVILERRLESHAGRLRVIAIDNRPEDEPIGSGEIRLGPMSEREVNEVLALHFPQLDAERRRAFVDLSAGFVRLAVELCRQSDLIPAEGHIGSVLTFFRDHYLRSRLRPEEQVVVEAISLLPRIGYRGDLRQQLEGLCQAVGLTPDQVVQTASRLKQAPGFIALGERYLYVTPRLIAQAAFQCAWNRWIRSDPEHFFLNRFPGEMIDQMAEQVRACGTEEMRQAFSRFFHHWTSRLGSKDLGKQTTVHRLVRLVEVEPCTLLPRLRRLIESLPVEELRKLHGPTPVANGDGHPLRQNVGGQNARRELVWLADKFLHLPEHFADAERILLRLALAETEPYSNNASGVWKDIFRPYLSGTSLPFTERLQLLEQRFQTTDETQLALCLDVLPGPLSADRPLASRVLGPPIVAGRIPPADWEPADAEEEHECWVATVELLGRLSKSQPPTVREGLVNAILQHLSDLLWRGFLPQVAEIIESEPLPDARLVEVLRELDRFLEYHCSPDSKRVPEKTEAAIRDWRRRLVPNSLHGRLVDVVGQDPWHRGGETQRAEEALTAIARELLHDTAALDRELPWLCAGEARSAPHLGMILGKLDETGGLLERLLTFAVQQPYPGIARGYIRGLLQNHPAHLDRVNRLLDGLEQAYPRAVFDMISAGVDALRPVERILHMVDADLLPAEFLRGVSFAVGHRPLQPDELRPVLERLLGAAQQENEAAARAALHILRVEFHQRQRASSPPPLEGVDCSDLVESLLAVSLPFVGPEAETWGRLLAELGQVEPEAAIRMAIQGLASEDPPVAREALDYLTGVAPQSPEIVMRHLGDALLAGATRWRLTFRRLQSLIQALPVETVLRWLHSHEAPAAVVLARHLPLPYIDDSGVPVVPELTAHVLEQFAGDEQVFREFCAAAHSGELSWGDLAERREREAETARRFLDHDLRRIREWAQHEIDQASRDTDWWRAQEEEMAAH